MLGWGLTRGLGRSGHRAPERSGGLMPNSQTRSAAKPTAESSFRLGVPSGPPAAGGGPNASPPPLGDSAAPVPALGAPFRARSSPLWRGHLTLLSRAGLLPGWQPRRDGTTGQAPPESLCS